MQNPNDFLSACHKTRLNVGTRTKDKRFDFGVYPDLDSDAGIF